MTEFPALLEALHTWVLDVAATFADDSEVHYQDLTLPGWGCDGDGIFRNISRPVEVWNFRQYERLRDLDSWPRVEKAFRENDGLSRQVDTFVGTMQGGGQVAMFGLAMHILPRPDELSRASEVFEDRYAELEAYLLADELEYKTLWPLPGLIVKDTPIELESDVVLDVMSDPELTAALRSEIVRPVFPGHILFKAEPHDRTCIRYRYRLPKLIGPRQDDADKPNKQFQELEQRRQEIGATIEESLSLVLPEPVMPAGRFDISGEQWNPHSGGVGFRESMMPRHARWRRIGVDAERASALVEVWQQVSQRGLLTRHKGLALGKYSEMAWWDSRGGGLSERAGTRSSWCVFCGC